AREHGIRVQAAVSPTLPHDHPRFADLLADSADRVIVDTFFGDGSGGKRTGRRPLPARFRELGYGDWRDEGAAERLLAAVRERMGPDHAGWSRDGFNDLAVVAREGPARQVASAPA
ncbi:MAG: hypothetical protein WEE64_01170, partial [Dehalococcoidia bacterium]